MSAMLKQLVKTSSKRIDGEKVQKKVEPSISIPFFFFMQHKRKYQFLMENYLYTKTGLLRAKFNLTLEVYIFRRISN